MSDGQIERDDCYFCSESSTEVLETHHIVPVRFGGSDDPENLVRVCPTCHEKLERLYDARFYEQIQADPIERAIERDSYVCPTCERPTVELDGGCSFCGVSREEARSWRKDLQERLDAIEEGRSSSREGDRR